MTRKIFSPKGVSEKRSERSERVSHRGLSEGRVFQTGITSKCKGPGEGVCSAYWRNRKEASVAGVENGEAKGTRSQGQ